MLAPRLPQDACLTVRCAAALPLTVETGHDLSAMGHICDIDMVCRGDWSNCHPPEATATLRIAPSEAMVERLMDAQSLHVDTMTPGRSQCAIAAPGMTADGFGSHVMPFSEGRFDVVISTDRRGEGLFRAYGRFSGTCEVAP